VHENVVRRFVAAIGAHGHKTDRVFACIAVERGLEVQYGKLKR
jgi:hypothetical protein